ncbi:MAG: cupin domain-containing protein, partial [Muribaculaceae bacterium]|nr:cupin domain-containing protein [Muribaculaceae bacterium]
MQIILLSGGSGTRLWPLSNDARSKQFLRLLPVEGSEERESMVQRVVRQIREADLKAPVTVATSVTQQDSIISQLGNEVNIVTEPSRRDTFPAICLASEYLSKVKGCADDEVVVVMPCDPYTEAGYFNTIHEMEKCVEEDVAELVLMGIRPTYPSSKYGYVVPQESGEWRVENREGNSQLNFQLVKRFTEKPDVPTAEKLIAEGAFWNGGVFAFRLGYLRRIAEKYVEYPSFEEIRDHYADFPKISFDYEVAEKADSVAVVPFDGEWRDLGTWNTLTDELRHTTYGNVTTDGNGENTHIINELDIPVMCIGTKDLVVAASPDGILVSEKSRSEDIKKYADRLKRRPMYEERRWGSYKVIDFVEFPDGFSALTKQLTLNPGCSISYQEHNCRDEVWTFIDGEGEIVLDGVRKTVRRGDTIRVMKGQRHALRARTPLTFIEVQSGSELVET